jgi:hypothetical protein
MRRIGFWLLLMIHVLNVSGQQNGQDVINVSGNSAMYAQGYLAWSVGEAIVGQAQTATASVKQGFLQSQPSRSQKLFLKLFLQGLWNGSGLNKSQNASGDAYAGEVADKIEVALHPAGNYGTVAYSKAGVNLTTAGLATIELLALVSGEYYVTVNHRNTLSTTSMPVTFSGSGINYDFTVMASRAFGSNQVELSEGVFGFYAGDANQDGAIDVADIEFIGALAATFGQGYIPGDINGDGQVDALDLILTDNNAAGFVTVVEP